MTTFSQAINNHYGQADLGVTILTALQRAGKNVNALTRDDIASFDEFHIRGRKATQELARLADLKAGTKVLDLGCGIGGTARTLATEFGCQVTGIDLVDTYIQTAEMLNLRIGLNDDRITFQHGSVLAMPFDNASFEAALSLHLTMNIQDKTQLVQEVRRVLRPEGRFALYEICAGSVSTPHFPVPWAGDSSINFLVEPKELRQMVNEAGFKELVWEDVTAATLEWFQAMKASRAARPADAPPPLGLNLIMGATTAEKIGNLRRNLEEDRVRVIQGVFQLTVS
jgi:ubiquinone/menaquinone biosynthesis C-methylase UbiE